MRVAGLWICLLLPLQAREPEPAAGLVVKDGIPGTREGHAVAELRYWISWGDYDLAEASYRLGRLESDSESVRYLRSWALLCWSLGRKKGFDRVLAALEDIDSSDAAFRDQAAALAASVRAVMLCPRCDGRNRVRCVQCHGAGLIRTADDETGTPCGGCESGFLKCPACEGPRPAPSLEDVCSTDPCRSCGGRGLPLSSIRVPCGECRGLGFKVIPKVTPGRRLR
ncbi:MAG: hypothetical protein HY293_01920 [Planctomycetes bacterium]|nr:hypothetical protein [Planctomycetota bacterium]